MHAYDNPDLCSVEFLFTIMRDQTVDLYDRMNAAEKLCKLGLADIGTIRMLKVSISGGMPDDAKDLGPECQYGVASDAGKAPGHRPPRRHRGFYLVKNG